MTHPALSVTLLALAAPAAAAVADGAWAPVPPFTRLTIHEHVVIRVPRMPLPVPIRWKEKKGPACIAAQSMAGALVNAPDQVDVVLIGGERVRARLDRDCTPIDFYSGFYVRPSRDGLICAGRDAIRVRSGAACGIDVFRRLIPRR